MSARILVLEDEPAILQMLNDLLTAEGYDCIPVSHPSLAVAVAEEQQPDCFLIDIMLPERSGIEVADDLRACGFAATPMIAMSASSIMRDLSELAGQFDATIGKPFDMADLVAAIQQMLAARAQQQSFTPRD